MNNKAQKLFDKLYKEKEIFLTDSTTINSIDMIEAALNKMYFQENISIEDIQKKLENILNSFKISFVD